MFTNAECPLSRTREQIEQFSIFDIYGHSSFSGLHFEISSNSSFIFLEKISFGISKNYQVRFITNINSFEKVRFWYFLKYKSSILKKNLLLIFYKKNNQTFHNALKILKIIPISIL